MESDSMRTQLSTLATQLQKAVNIVKPVEKTSQQQRAAFFGQVVSEGVRAIEDEDEQGSLVSMHRSKDLAARSKTAGGQNTSG